MPCASWLNATLSPPWSWPQAHWLCISLGYFPGTLPYQSRKSSRRMQGASVEMPPHTPSAIKTFANSTSQKLFIIQAIVIHPLILSPIPQNGIAKKVILPPKKYDLFSILDSSWLFQTEEFNVCAICTIRIHAITAYRTQCYLLLLWGRASSNSMLLPLAQSLLCGVCYTSLSPHVL